MTTRYFGIAARGTFGALALALLTTHASHAQLANASASTLGMAGNNTALVRGFGAISVNPAGLGMPGSGFSLTVAPVQVRLGLAPVKVGDLYDFQGQVVPDATKSEWLDRVIDAGGEAGAVGADATAFALTLGNVGFQVSTTASTELNLPPGSVEGLLFGNAGRTGTPADLDLADASFEGFALTTAAMSFALPVSPSLVFGLTGKYTHGHGLAVGRALSGAIESNPIQGSMDFPMVTSCADEIVCTQDFVEGGSGFGIDLGAMVDLGTITLGASLQNVINSFAWDETKLGYRPGTVFFDTGDFQSDYDELPFDQAPADLQAIVADYTLKPSFRMGAALDVSPIFTLTGDIHGRLADEGIALQPGYHTGVGAELRAGFLHLRGGLTKMTDGMQYGGGTSLVLGPVNLSGAVGLQKSDLSDTVMAQFGLSFGNR
jgi:hypothetical protein